MSRQYLKPLLIFIAIVLTTLIFSFVFRNQLALRLANHYLNQYDIILPCADFSLTRTLDVNIDQLCLDHPLAKTQLHGVKVRWSMFPHVTVHDVQLDRIDIKGVSPLVVAKNSDDKPFTANDFHQIMAKVAALTLPASISINQFTYQPYNQAAQSNEQYNGHVSASNDGIAWSLTDQQNHPVFTGQLTTNGNSLKGNVKTDFIRIRDFLLNHNLQALESFTALVDVKGQLSTQFDWQSDYFTAHNQLDNLIISSEKGLFNSGPFTINTQQSWQTTLDKNVIQIQIETPHPITLDVDDKAIVDLLTTQKLPPQLLTLLKDNPTQGLTILPQGSVQIDLEKKQASLFALKVQNRNQHSPLTIKLGNILLRFDQNLIGANFDVNTTAKVTALATVTKMPVSIQTKGSITKTAKDIKLEFAPESHIKLTKLKLSPSTKSAKASTTNKPNILLSAAQSKWQGSVNISKDILTTDIKVQIQLHQLFAKKWAKAALTQINSQIKGSPSNITINGSLTTDDIALAQFKVSGDINKPTINISAKDIQLIDLLGLNLNKSVEIELIDGSLDYQLSGQLTDFNAMDQNPLVLSLTVRSLSGEVDKTWIQDVNWHQQFKLEKGQLSTNANTANFSLSLIEVGTPLTEIKATTNFSQIQQRFSLTLDNVSGKAFGGVFAIPDFTWPAKADKPLVLQLDGIDLAKVVALEKQKGIVVTGRVSGQLPVYIAPDGITISEGELHNITDGLIQIMDNPAVQQLKLSRTELKLAFDALQNLQYHQLTSTVTMTKDGQMLLETAIKGRNPDLDNEVNFNLNLDYDLLGLIKSARIADTFEQTINEQVKE